MKSFTLYLFFLFIGLFACNAQVIVNHESMDISDIPDEWITNAKETLHIAYGHTSHGSQITTGMNGLVTFTGGVGGPQFAWNSNGANGELHLHDYAMAGDCGYYPQWVDNTTAYLDNPENSEINVVMWSWCGQISYYTEQNLIDYYIEPMCVLEESYPNVKFVYMTGHLTYGAYENTTLRNQQLRDFCFANEKILYDFADIESYDPDGIFYTYANDNCDYYANLDETSFLGNWAINWQDDHVEGIDWYQCSSAHSQPLNANQKAYAAWYLWSRLAGWSGSTGVENFSQEKVNIFPNPVNDLLTIKIPENGIERKLEIRNLAGQKVYTGFISHTCTISTSDFASGVYYLSVENGDEQVFLPFVKK